MDEKKRREKLEYDHGVTYDNRAVKQDRINLDMDH